jgi:hypothetical protein
MARLSVLTWIGNAAAVLLGRHGDVSTQARSAACSRQSVYDHADKVQQALADVRGPGPCRADLLRQVEQLRQENRRLREQLAGRIELNPPRRRRLAATTSAMGLSLSQIEDVFSVLLDGQPEDVGRTPPPSRAAIGRWVLAACLLAGVALRVLDGRARALAKVLCLDEIFFHGKPVLVAVEPHSMAVLLCDKTADRTGQTWQQALLPFPGLEHAVADAGTGLQAGLRAVQRDRGADKPLTVSLDVFHLEKEARQALGWLWRKVEARWHQADQADARAGAAKPQQRSGRLSHARAAWDEVARYWDWYARWEAAWARLKTALHLFRPDGLLNDRVWAAAEIRAACTLLPGPKWRKVRRMANDRRMLGFLDRLQKQLEEAEPRPQVREALVELWRLERQGGQAALTQAVAQQLLVIRLAADWQQAYGRVSGVLGGVVRASSAVECVNSVLRMQQGRHRNVSQAMLDLKRLYWNCREVKAGKREGKCPYQHLGVALRTYDFWEVLNSDPAELAQQLSSPKVAA